MTPFEATTSVCTTLAELTLTRWDPEVMFTDWPYEARFMNTL